MAILNKLSKIFDRQTKMSLFFLLIGILFAALLEMGILALISPLISVLLEPEMIYSDPLIYWAYTFLGFDDADVFLIFLIFLLVALYVFRGFYIYILNRVKFIMIANKRANLSKALFHKMIHYPFRYHAKTNIAEIQRIVVTDVEQLFLLIINTLNLITDFSMALLMFSFLMVVSPTLSLLTLALALICVILYLGVFKKQIKAVGAAHRSSNIQVTKMVNQSFGGIKEVKVLGRESYFSDVFNASNKTFVMAFAKVHSFNVLPGLTLETVCFGGAFLILGMFMLSGADISDMIPQLSLFVVAAFRLLPAVARQVSSIHWILFYKTSVEGVYRSLYSIQDNHRQQQLGAAPVQQQTTPGIQIDNLSFAYPDADKNVLSNLSFTIPEKNSVALIGPTGAGKTTLADLILGIQQPNAGSVFYNGRSVHHNLVEWNKKIGYIPQQIYLLDESIRANVAFGIDPAEISDEKVWQALDKAQLKDHVLSLSTGLDTIIGEGGVRLSGGQRQRLGIARAIYEDPEILVLDEATSALDNDTEKAVMDAIMHFKGDKTMIIIAHRLSTIEHCDLVYEVENQNIKQLR